MSGLALGAIALVFAIALIGASEVLLHARSRRQDRRIRALEASRMMERAPAWDTPVRLRAAEGLEPDDDRTRYH